MIAFGIESSSFTVEFSGLNSDFAATSVTRASRDTDTLGNRGEPGYSR